MPQSSPLAEHYYPHAHAPESLEVPVVREQARGDHVVGEVVGLRVDRQPDHRPGDVVHRGHVDAQGVGQHWVLAQLDASLEEPAQEVVRSPLPGLGVP